MAVNTAESWLSTNQGAEKWEFEEKSKELVEAVESVKAAATAAGGGGGGGPRGGGGRDRS